MAIRIGAHHQPGFDEPLQLLSDCHRRIEHFLQILLTIASQAHSGDGTLSDEQRRALDTALTYFRTAAPRHTADEEQSLFPRMRETGGTEAQAALDRLAELEADHRTADAQHLEVDEIGKTWLQTGSLPPEKLDRLMQLLQSLTTLYQRHIAMEDQEVFPIAKSALSAEQVAEVGREMARRRGLAVDEQGRVIPQAMDPRGRSG